MGKRTFAVVGAYCTGDIFGTALCGNCGTAKEVNMHRIQAKNILSATNGMNLYRGCTHGCIYCDSRSACYQMGHDFEDVAVKENAPQLLEEALRRKRRLCMIGTGAMSDPYLHCEEQLGLTRQCLELIAKYGFGAAVLTKSDRVLRDLDLLQKIQQNAKCVVQMTLTTWNETLCRILEPHVCTTRRRYEVLKIMQANGIPGDRDFFYAQLDKHFPGMKEQYIRRFGNAYECSSPNQARLMTIFRESCAKYDVMYDPYQIFAYLRELPECNRQLSLF